MIHVNRVHHIAIICSDYERSLEFYKTVLGFTVLAENYREQSKGYKTDLALGDQYVIELFSFPSPPARPTNPEAAGLRHLAFEVDDILCNTAGGSLGTVSYLLYRRSVQKTAGTKTDRKG
jgi:glyoxylase I family protein